MTASLRSRIEVLFGVSGGFVSLLRTDAEVLAAMRGEGGRRRPTDLFVARDGRRLVCVMGQPIELRTTVEGPASVSAANAAGARSLFAPGGHTVPGRASDGDVLSLVEDAGARFTVHVDGAIRRDGERIAEIERARQIRASGQGVLAILSEHEGGSTVRLVDRAGTPIALLPGGLPLGGAAWSPDGSELALRTPAGVAIHDPHGALVRAIPVALPSAQAPLSGRIAWTTRGILALHDTQLLWIDGGAVRAFRAGAEVLLSLAPMHRGPLVALTTIADRGGISFVDLDRGEHAPLSWATHLLPDSPIQFLADDGALVWADLAGTLHLVPFGDLPTDPRTGEAIDPDLHYLQTTFASLDRERKTDDALAEITKVLDTRTFRPGLESSVALLRGRVESMQRERTQRAREAALFKPAAAAPFAVGDRARHAKFGEGPVTAAEGSGAEAKITVAFESGPRTLKASFLTRA